MYTTLIPTSALDSARDATWVVVDCRFDLQRSHWGRDQYLAAHIPGAIYADLATDLSGPRTGRNGRHPWPSPDALVTTFSSMGIGPDTQVVAYDQDIGMFASRLWYLLRSMGHTRAAVLDGGWAHWTREQRPVSAGEETRAAATFVPAPGGTPVLDVDEVQRLLRSRPPLLVDARSPERFDGSAESVDPVGGHIPGAVNRHFRDNAGADGLMRAPETLRREWQALLGGRAPGDTVMYCGSGVTACHNLLALEHAGLTGSRLYAGSWSEWCADPDRPVETGS